MKYIFYISSIFLLVHCTPKVAEQVSTSPMGKDPLAWRAEAPGPGPARAINMGESDVFTLDNGLTVIVVENHKIPRVSYGISLVHEQPLEGEEVGYLSFAGQMLKRGTTNRTKSQLDQEIDFLGASLNTSSFGVNGSSLTKHQDKLLELMTDVLYNPSFPEEEFEKIRTQTLSGIQANKTDPNAIAGNVAAVVNYGTNHPYGEIPTEKTTNAITLESCIEYYNTYFKPNNAYLTIVGDISPIVAKAKARKYFGSWKSGDVPENSYPLPSKPNGARVCVANKDGAVQSVINITYPVDLKPGTDNVLPVSVMNSILGGGIFSGRLMQNLREDKAFTYGARSSVRTDRLVGTFNASASVRNEVTDSSVHEFLYEMNRIASEPVSADDLDLTKNSMAGSFARSLESPGTIARFARNIVRYNLPDDYYETYLQRLEAISIADVQRAARQYITPDRANIVVVGSKDEISEPLKRFDADGEIEYFDAFGNKLEIKESALPSDLNGMQIVKDYLNAIGGQDKLSAVKSMELHYGMNIMGQAVNVDIYKMAPNKFAMKVGNESMVMQETKFDGTTAYAGGMGGSQKATEGPVFEEAKSNAVMFSQAEYLKDDYSLDLKGIEDVDGKSCYKLVVTDPNGERSTEYYDSKTSLLLREVMVREAGPGNTVTITQDFQDYKEVNGISIPHKIVTSGAMPVPMEMNATSVKINSPLDTSMFNID